MKYLGRLKSIIRLPNELPKLPKGKKQSHDVLPKLPKTPYDSFGSTEGRHLSEKVSTEPQPYLEVDGGLVIPFGSDRRYWWWAGGQSVTETIEELKRVYM